MLGQTSETERRESAGAGIGGFEIADPNMVAWMSDPLRAEIEGTFEPDMPEVSAEPESCTEDEARSGSAELRVGDAAPPDEEHALASEPRGDAPAAAEDAAAEDDVSEDDVSKDDVSKDDVSKEKPSTREIDAAIGDRLSSKELGDLAALSLSPPDLEALLEASDRIQAEAEYLQSREVDLQPVIEEIHDLRDSLASYQGLEHLLVELSQNSESTNLSLTNYLDVLFDEIASLRRDAEITRDATLVFTNTVRELVRAMSPSKIRERQGRAPSSKLAVAAAVIGSLLAAAVVVWAVLGFQRTSELHFAVIGLLVVNIVSGGALLWFRRS